MDTVDTYRDILSGMFDIYLSSISNRLNEVMKVLTIIATIFMPLTFLAGIYGMNFEHMPELKWQYGYFMLWGVMIVIALTMLSYFGRRSGSEGRGAAVGEVEEVRKWSEEVKKRVIASRASRGVAIHV